MKRCLNCMKTYSVDNKACPFCGFDPEKSEEQLDQLKPGTLLKGRFIIGNPLGRGGFGITYIAWDNDLQRKVAVKEYLPRGLAVREPGNTTVSCDYDTKDAFLRGVEKTIEESRKLAVFSELESVVRVYDCFKANGTAYIIMEALSGENARKKLEKVKTFSFEETLKIMTPVLETLAEVHKTGIIHRDVSPDNIFICDNGRVKLLDFGSARIADNADERSRSIVLKHGYAPVEQYTSKGRQGPFTDIYSACATIYKMLTGITPVDSLDRVSGADELEDISALAKLPSPAARAVTQGMAVKPADRIQSAEELLRRLKEKEPAKPDRKSDETLTLHVPLRAPKVIPDKPVPFSGTVPQNSLKAPGSVSNNKAEQEPLLNISPKEIFNVTGLDAKAEEINIDDDDEFIPFSDLMKEFAGSADDSRNETHDSHVNVSRGDDRDIIYKESKKAIKAFEEQENIYEEARKIIQSTVYFNFIKNKEGIKSSLSSIARKYKIKYVISAAVVLLILISVINLILVIKTFSMPKPNAEEDIISSYKSLLSEFSAGETVTFGSYEQDNNTSNGREAVEWRVLTVEENKMLLISEYALDCRAYNTDSETVTWETCSLRKWLNESFYKDAFTGEEKAYIKNIQVKADSNPEYDTNPGRDTEDKMFLLSFAEVAKYFTAPEDRICRLTNYTKANGAWTNGKEACWWWLRSSGIDEKCAACIRSDGDYSYIGGNVNSVQGSVRPAMWIEI